MTNVDKLKEEELKNLQEDEELFDLEELVTGGKDVRVPVKIIYPKYNEETGEVEMVPTGALLRPLSNVEWNNCTRLNRAPNSKTSNEVELLKKALYKPNGEQMPPMVVEAMPNGIVIELVKEVSRISGIDIKANMELAKKMAGFSV